jgi:hypothetical protein
MNTIITIFPLPSSSPSFHYHHHHHHHYHHLSITIITTIIFPLPSSSSPSSPQHHHQYHHLTCGTTVHHSGFGQFLLQFQNSSTSLGWLRRTSWYQVLSFVTFI